MCRIDPQVAAATPRPEIAEAAQKPELSLAESLAVIMDGYADRPALGERVSEVVTDPATGGTSLRLTRRIATVTYRELWSRAGAIAADLQRDPRAPVRAGDAVATLGFTSGDYATVELASMRLGTVSVPLPAGATPANVRSMIDETSPRVLAASLGSLDKAVDALAGGTSVRRVVVFDCREEVDAHREALGRARRALAGPGVAVDTLQDAFQRGAGLPAPPLAGVDPTDPDALSLVLYTSGSTGAPKGAMFPQRVAKAQWRPFLPNNVHPILSLHFMPLSHIGGRVILFNTFIAGGTAHFVATPDLSTMLEDFELIRPTELVLVPRVCDLLYQHYRRELAHRGGDRAAAELKDELRTRQLGGRVVWAGSGSAPLSPELATFMESVLGVPMHDGYGSTELGSMPLLDGRPNRWVDGCRLADVPELGYFSTDAPHPRGELLLKTDTVVPGYLNRPGVQMLDAEGFYHTGDIMAEVEPERFVYIDRRNNVLKLAQGEFVTLSKLEALYVASPLVQQIYVYGNSERAYLLAVIVPTPQALAAAGGDLDLVRTRVGQSLRELARNAGLNSYEVPRDFILETEPFSVENGLLSSVRKLVRPKLAERYGPRLDAMYAEISASEAEELRRLRETGRDEAVTDTVVRAARAILGAGSGPPDPGAYFTDLGGDSLSAVELSSLLEEIFGVEVPAGVVASPSRDLRGVAVHIERSLRAAGARPTFATVHGAGATTVRASDLALDTFIDAETLAGARSLPRGTGAVRTVLLTGANGYLGRFLCLEWLERMAGTDGRLVCLVRGNSEEAARARLQRAFGAGAPLDRFRDLECGHLRVLPGDIGEPNLGLDQRTWCELAETVDLIVHPAALVNHVLPYQQLFGPNVAGTAEIVRLALTMRSKPVNYVSTVAAVMEASSADEGCDVRVTSPERTLDGGYANGYAVSKWAGEVLLREAHDAFGLPVVTFRPDMILAHRRFPGQLNSGDMFTRLLVSLLATGIAPGSFYRGGERAHFDGLPVDFTAEAITTLGRAAGDGYHTYNVVNPHSDGISLDTFVDWLAGSGHMIQRIGDYVTWFGRFETALRALPERQKQWTLLPLLHAFAEPAAPRDTSMVPAGQFEAAVRTLGAGTDHHIPQVSAALIQKYVTDLEEAGLI